LEYYHKYLTKLTDKRIDIVACGKMSMDDVMVLSRLGNTKIDFKPDYENVYDVYIFVDCGNMKIPNTNAKVISIRSGDDISLSTHFLVTENNYVSLSPPLEVKFNNIFTNYSGTITINNGTNIMNVTCRGLILYTINGMVGACLNVNYLYIAHDVSLFKNPQLFNVLLNFVKY